MGVICIGVVRSDSIVVRSDRLGTPLAGIDPEIDRGPVFTLDVRHGFEIESGADPVTDLKQFVNQIFTSIDPDSDEQEVPVGVYIEIRTQAVSNEAYRERITDIDRALKEQFQSILQRGIDQELVWDIDVDQVSEYLVTTIIGVIERYATTETVSVDIVQAEIEQYLNQRVIA